MDAILKDFSAGPLDIYRKGSSFKWQEMALLLEPAESLLMKHKIWRTLEDDPLFMKSQNRLPIKEYRHLTMQRVKKVIGHRFLPIDALMKQPEIVDAFVNALGQYDWSVMVKHQLLCNFVVSTLAGLGTEKHMAQIMRLMKNEIGACFCLTEISHGTNTKAMRTTATFDPQSKEFILRTPDFEAAKCWSGNLGETATHAVVFAGLITPDGENHGLHAFFVQIRDTKTFENLPGVSIGDMGEKLGLNGVDNGVMMFDSFRIPSDALLNRTGDVDENGKYVSPFKDKKKRLGASLGNLSAGRVGIVGMSKSNLVKAITVAIRYSAVRRQFGPEDSSTELPVIEYQLQQWRLFPYLAAAYVLIHFSQSLRADFIQMQRANMMKKDPERQAAVGAEIHALSSCAKPVASWFAQDGIQLCREACGGHGYLAVSGFGSLREDNDANCTYEGDNNVLLQQSTNWLLNLWSSVLRGKSIQAQTPLGSASFLDSGLQILKSKCNVTSVDQWFEPKASLAAYEFVICQLLQSTTAQLSKLTSQGLDLFAAKNRSQAYYYRPLSIAYAEASFLRRMIDFIEDPKIAVELRTVLKRLAALFGAFNLEKNASILNHGYFQPATTTSLHSAIEELCALLKPDAVALVDAVAPPDFILNSALGHSDGQVYKHLQEQFSGSFKERPHWWEMILQPPSQSKL